MTDDFRREWIKQKVTDYFGLDSFDQFEEMMANEDNELEYELSNFLDEELDSETDSKKRIFYVYRTFYDKFIDQEIIVPEVGKIPKNKL